VTIGDDALVLTGFERLAMELTAVHPSRSVADD